VLRKSGNAFFYFSPSVVVKLSSFEKLSKGLLLCKNVHKLAWFSHVIYVNYGGKHYVGNSLKLSQTSIYLRVMNASVGVGQLISSLT